MFSPDASDFSLIKRLFGYLKSYRGALFQVYALYLANGILNLLPAASLRYYFDFVISKDAIGIMGLRFDPAGVIDTTGDQVMGTLVYFGSISLLIIGANAIGVVMHRRGTKVAQFLLFDIKREVVNKLHSMSFNYFDRERTGSIMSRAVGDVDRIEQMVKQSFNLLYSLIHFVFAPLIMIGMSPILFLFVLPPLPIIAFAMYRIRILLRPIYRKMREKQAEIGANIQEQISGIREIKAFERNRQSYREYSRANVDYIRHVNDAMRTWSFNHQLIYGLNDFAMVLVAVGGGLLVIQGSETITLGVVISFIPLLNRFYQPLSTFLNFYDVIQRGLASAQRVFDLLDEDPEVKDRAEAANPTLEHGEIEFEDVTFHYKPDSPGVHNLSFRIRPGEQVAVVGASGAGKSTLVSLMLRFYEQQSGCIRVDGHDLREITQQSILRAIGMVFQENFLFHGTVAENIALARPRASREDIVQAARQANILESIEQMPEGFDTIVGERGARLSGGQRQRIAIARMILKDPPIIILDEATSAIDTKTERAIQASLNALLKGRTAIVIAHRLSTIRNINRVLVLDQGCLVEDGSPTELEQRNGPFAELVAAQEG
ncbi:MAG: ABC transporter ATP-binding protein [Opitutales bacterium]